MNTTASRYEPPLEFSTAPERILDGGFIEALINGEGVDEPARRSALGVRDERDWMVVHAEFPGVDPACIEIRTGQGVLTLADGCGCARRNGEHGAAFLQTVPLPVGADVSAMVTLRAGTTFDVIIPKTHGPAARD